MAMTLITTNPDSTDVASVEFTSSIDSTYKLYIFKFIDVNAATDNAFFQFQGSIDGGSNYNVTATNAIFRAQHGEDDVETSLAYQDEADQAQSTAYMNLNQSAGNGADESLAGTLWLFNPSNTTYVKHFYSTTNLYQHNDTSQVMYSSGYFNTTSAIDAINFKQNSGNFDGVIKMYGVG